MTIRSKWTKINKKYRLRLRLHLRFVLSKPSGKDSEGGKTVNDGTHCKNSMNRFTLRHVCGGSLPFINWIYRKYREIFSMVLYCFGCYCCCIALLLQLMEVILSFDPFYRMRCHLFIAHNNSFCEWTHISCHGLSSLWYNYIYTHREKESEMYVTHSHLSPGWFIR